MAFTIHKAQLSVVEAPAICGVTIRPHILIRRDGSASVEHWDDVPEEASSDARFCVRVVWYRSVVNRSGACCWVHTDREATVQVVPPLRSGSVLLSQPFLFA